MGCCSHKTAVIYYLSYNLYLSKIPRPAEYLSLFESTEMLTIVAKNIFLDFLFFFNYDVPYKNFCKN